MKNKANIILIIIIAVFILFEITGIFGAFQKAIYAFDDEAQEAHDQAIAQEAYEQGYQDGYSDGLLEVQREAN